MEKEKLIDQIKKSSRIVRIMYLVSFVMLAVVAVMLMSMIFELSGIISNSNIPFASLVNDFWKQIELDYEHLPFLDKLIYLNMPTAVFRIIMILEVVLEIAVYIISIRKLYGIFKSLSSGGRPFDSAILKDIKLIAWMHIVITVLQNPVRGIVDGFVLWCLMKIYEYGCLLQEESDEVV